MLFPDLTNDELVERAERNLNQLDPVRLFPSAILLDHGDGRLQKEVRAFCTAVWPALFHDLTVQINDGIRIANQTKSQAIELGVDFQEEVHTWWMLNNCSK